MVSVAPGSTDLAWLEHTLLSMFKTPTEFGAKLWNGVDVQLKLTERGPRRTPAGRGPEPHQRAARSAGHVALPTGTAR